MECPLELQETVKNEEEIGVRISWRLLGFFKNQGMSIRFKLELVVWIGLHDCITCFGST